MASAILYNKLLLELDIDKIAKDFFVYKVTKDDGWFENKKIFDLPTTSLKARSVVYERGSSFYILFDKNHVPDYQIRAMLEAQDPDVRIKPIGSGELKEVPKHTLTQLLLNMLNTCEDIEGKLMYSNISGGLFFPVEAKENYIVMLQIKLTDEMLVRLDIVTFSKQKAIHMNSIAEQISLNKAPRYRYDKSNGRLIGDWSKDAISKTECYVRRNFRNKKNTKSFLEFNRLNFEKYEYSKIGLFCKFMQDVEKELEEYILDVRLDALPVYSEYLPEAQGISLDWSQAQQTGINFVNLLGDKTYSSTMKKVRKHICEQYGIPVTSSVFRADSLNVVLIHDKEYYQDKTGRKNNAEENSRDPYQITYPGIVQHVTLENFLQSKDSKQLQLATKKIIQDLLIKQDIFQKRLTLVNWESEVPWTFVQAVEQEQSTTIRYYKMTIHPNKTIVFDSFANIDWLSNGSENQRIDSAFRTAEKRVGGRYHIEGLFYCGNDLDNIFVLSRTDAYTMPLYKEMDQMMRATKPTCEIWKETILQELEHFISQCQRKIKEEDLLQLRKNLRQCSSMKISIGSLIKGISVGSILIQEFNQFLIKEGSMPLTPNFKVGDNKEKYFSAFVGVKYYVQEGALYYFVGTKGHEDIQTSISKRCIIRRVDSTSGEIPDSFVCDFFRYLTVDFIREKQHSVLPFQFKYLREYIKNPYLLERESSNASLKQ